MYVYKNNNHKNRRTGDCTIRAFMEIVDQSPEEILKELVDVYLKTGYFIDDPKGYDKWLNTKGYFKQKQARKDGSKRYKADEFCEYLNKTITSSEKFAIPAHVGGNHISVFVWDEKQGYVLQDIWDCSDRCVGNYWIKL